MIVYFLPSVSGLTRWVDYIPVKFTTVATAATENTYNQNGYIPVVSLSSIAGATPFKEYVPVFLDSSAADADVWDVTITGFIPVGTAGIGGAALYLDFAATTSLDPRITFSRTTNATVTGSNGLIQNAPMNLLTFSEQFDNAYWGKTNATVTANTLAVPNGTTTAETISDGVAAGLHYIESTAQTLTGTYTASVYAKKGTSNFIGVYAQGVSQGVFFNLNTGAFSSNIVGAPTAYSITLVSDGWYRCTITFAASAASVSVRLFTSADGSTFNYTGNNNTVYVWGAQLELGSTATTYNPTTVKNLLGFTESFDNAAWTKSNASISATKVDDIYGQPFAQKLVEDTATSEHRVRVTSITKTASSLMTYSVYVKPSGRLVQLSMEFTGIGLQTVFDVEANTYANYDNVGWTRTQTIITPAGNGWYRCSISGITDSGSAVNVRIQLATNLAGINQVYTGDGTSGIYIFGAQLSDSASVDPYVYQPVAAPTSTAYYGPRFDYDPVTLAPKGLLIEEQRTNLLLRSEEFDSVSWSKANATITANSVVAPNGTTTADTFVSTATAGASSGANQGVTGTVAAYTFSIYAKAGTVNFLRLALTSNTVAANAWFNLATGVVGTVESGVTASITAAGNGWYRCSVTRTLAAVSETCFIRLADLDNSLSAPSGSTLSTWGAQLEAGAFATSYIPTVASQVTRAADSASMIGNNFARWYNPNTGTFYLEASGRQPALVFSNATSGYANYRSLYRQPASANQPVIAFEANAGVTSANLTLGLTDGNPFKAAYAYATNNFAGSLNGAAVVTDTSGTPALAVDRMGIGTDYGAGAAVSTGLYKRIAFYSRVLSPTEQQGITS
jgi:hypothetical protein